MEVTMTLDTKQRPDSVTVKANGHVYGATFADYRDNWEPAYLVIFPSEIHWTKEDRKSTRLNSSHDQISYAVFCLKKKKQTLSSTTQPPDQRALASSHRTTSQRGALS